MSISQPSGSDIQRVMAPGPGVGDSTTVTDASGLVRPAGITIGASSKRHDATVASISDSCEKFWGLRPEEVLDRPVLDFITWPRARRVRRAVERIGPLRGRDFRGDEWFVTLTYRFNQPMVHLEPVPADLPDDTTLWLAGSSERLEYIDDAIELWAEACENIRLRLGFDRSVAVRFHDDGHGEVVAESIAEGLPALLGMHFPPPETPAGPPVSAPVRSVGFHDVDALPSLIVPRTDPGGHPWDLTLSPLRRGTPGDLSIVKRMGASASFVLHLSGPDGLAYAIGSQSIVPRSVDALTRAGLELYAQAVHARVDDLHRAAETRRREETVRLQHRIVERVDTTGIASSLAAAPGDAPDLLELVRADAAVISIGDEQSLLGTLSEVERAAIDEAVRVWLATLSRHGALMTDRVGQVHPRLARAAPDVAGLLATSVGSQGDYLCWVRRPVAGTITWFGEASNERGRPTTRVEEINDRSPEWTFRDRIAAESLARELEDTLLRRAQAELAQLALVDVLTGLPNRRLLLDRLEKAIGRASRGHHFALLFLDLNDFKAVNDRFGHQMGDEVLIETARRLQDSMRDGDTVARLAGDEFVVLCEDTRLGEEAVVADRIREAFTRPFVIGGQAMNVGVAIGIGHLELGLDAPSLLDRADRAMYEAKSEMKRA